MIAGGLFSINKTTFELLGKYDTAMDIWVIILWSSNFNRLLIFSLLGR